MRFPQASALAGSLFVAILAAGPANATSYSFICESGCNSQLQGSLESSVTGLVMDVTNGVTGALFTFANNYPAGNPDPSVGGIYFDQGVLSLFSGIGVSSQTGAGFAVGGSPSNLPGGDGFTPPFSADFFATASGNPSNGLDTTADSVSILATFAGGVSFNQVISALNSGGLRVGLNVEPGGKYINAVPEPGTYALMLAGLLGVLGIARRRLR